MLDGALVWYVDRHRVRWIHTLMRIVRTENGDYFCGHMRLCVKRHRYGWGVFDASLVTDAQVRSGVYSPCILVCDDLDKTFAYCAMLLITEEFTDE